MEAPDTFDDLEALWLAWRAVQPEERRAAVDASAFLNLLGMPNLDIDDGWESSARRAVWLWITETSGRCRDDAKSKYEAWREEVKRERTTDIR